MLRVRRNFSPTVMVRTDCPLTAVIAIKYRIQLNTSKQQAVINTNLYSYSGTTSNNLEKAYGYFFGGKWGRTWLESRWLQFKKYSSDFRY